MRAGICVVLLACLTAAAPVRADITQSGDMRLVKVGDFSLPVFVASPPGDPSRVFVVEKAGTIRVVRDGTTLPTPFLSLSGVASVAEQGLLSMAFAPDYPTSGRFYVYYTDANACDSSGGCDVRVDEYARATPDTAGARVRNLFTVSHRQAGNHNGGTVAFGPDGLLYAAPGDGGPVGDPECDAQSPASRLGKILRADPNLPGEPLVPEVYALGLRNPFRFSFDRLTGDLLIGDVGSDSREEVDFLAAGAPPGANFGWNAFEGDLTTRWAADCPKPQPFNPIAPAISYPHVDGQPSAVTGGVVVRDATMAPLRGRYVYADFYAGDIRSALIGPAGASGDGPTGLRVAQLASFSEDALCRVYVTSMAGPVYRLEAIQPGGPSGCGTASAPPAPPPPAPAPDRTAPPAPPPPVPPPDRTAPVVGRLDLSHRRFRVSSAATPGIARTRTPVGTVFRFSLSEPAQVTLRFYRATPGRRVSGRCRAPTRARRRKQRCTRYLPKGRLVRRGMPAGRRRIPFTGRVGVRALAPSRYRATLRARDRAGNVSAGRSVRFTIVRRQVSRP